MDLTDENVAERPSRKKYEQVFLLKLERDVNIILFDAAL